MQTLHPDESFGHIVRNLNRLLQRELALRLARHGVSIGQWYVLRVLWLQDGLAQAEIAQRAGIAAPSVAVTLRSLAAERMIVREGHPTDQRKNVVYLTKKARQLEAPCLAAAAEVNAAALSGVAGPEIEQLLVTLGVAQRNLTGGDRADAAEGPQELRPPLTGRP
ncbi:MarR family winged helix-turn-helix transcriptional regulator [Salipiger abyssi]|uniref:Transcriptional regulator n=1 Tax=Salipiger abyssi TaxID=1250539 RepID=A0A1P8UX03_9RHOB|nr:MarR family winged helix-turn-helix transcriptional regulator [Salipiger abyssi]APZ53866.1 transcriptional regulator [Salipiger abyssi]